MSQFRDYKQIKLVMIPISKLVLVMVLLVSASSAVYFSSCIQSTTRKCVYGTNTTDRLLSLKKGGSNILSTSNYDSSFFPCEQYNYNCGYLQSPTQFVTIANGVQLNTTYSELLNWVPTDSTLTNMIKPYLSLQGEQAQCIGETLPLILTDTQSNSVLVGYLNRLTSNISTLYNLNKAVSSISWASLNINIKTAVLEMGKYNMNNNFIESTFWNNFLFNNFNLMSSELKANHTQYNCPQCLHSAQLIDSVTIACDKYQSINFLIDESGSIGAGPFAYAISFLQAYVNQTKDDLSLLSIHFFDSNFDPYIDYNNNRATMLNMLASKSYRGQGTYTGKAINASIAKINSGNFLNGVPKILVILTDGGSRDSVVEAANYARSFGIILFCVGIGANVNNAQLLQIASTQSNIINIQSYSTLSQLVSLISNYFCKQILMININQTIYGNVVRVPTSPSYFMVQRSNSSNQYYQLSISYQTDPILSQESITESHYDPFPDNFSQYTLSQNYRTSILTEVYFISPVSSEIIPVKKTQSVTSSPTYSYISVGAYSLNFNISLGLCNTSNCTSQRKIASSNSIDATGNNVNANVNLNSSTSSINTSIFMPIGLALGALGLCTFGTIFGLRKFTEAPQQQGNQLQPQNQGDGEIQRNEVIQNEEQPVNQDIEQPPAQQQNMPQNAEQED